MEIKLNCVQCERCGKPKIKDNEMCLCADEKDIEIARMLIAAKKGDEKCWTCGGTGRSDERLPIHEENDRLKSALIDAGQHATNEPKITLMDPRSDAIEEAMREHWGERCPEREESCPCCAAWKQLDDLHDHVKNSEHRVEEGK